jgi:hypothetical protein
MPLHCFDCGKKIKGINVWRDCNHRPLCKSCFEYNFLDGEIDDDAISWVMREIETTYNRDYNQFQNALIWVKCPRCQTETFFIGSNKNGDGSLYNEKGSEGTCYECNAFFIFDATGKVTKCFDDEDEFVKTLPVIQQN